VPGRLIGRERVPKTSLKYSVLKESAIVEVDFILAICFKDKRKTICSNV
jgi:hypothetical protein